MLISHDASSTTGSAVTPGRSASLNSARSAAVSERSLRSGPGHADRRDQSMSRPRPSERTIPQAEAGVRGPAPDAAQSCRRRSSARSSPAGASRAHWFRHPTVPAPARPDAGRVRAMTACKSADVAKRHVGRNDQTRRADDASIVLQALLNGGIDAAFDDVGDHPCIEQGRELGHRRIAADDDDARQARGVAHSVVSTSCSMVRASSARSLRDSTGASRALARPKSLDGNDRPDVRLSFSAHHVAVLFSATAARLPAKSRQSAASRSRSSRLRIKVDVTSTGRSMLAGLSAVRLVDDQAIEETDNAGQCWRSLRARRVPP